MVSKQIGISLIVVLFFLLVMSILAITTWRVAILEAKVIAYSAESDQLKKMAEKSIVLVEEQISKFLFSKYDCTLKESLNNCFGMKNEFIYDFDGENNKHLKTVEKDGQVFYLKGYWQEIYPAQDETADSYLQFYQVTAGAENIEGESIYIRTIFSRYYFK